MKTPSQLSLTVACLALLGAPTWAQGSDDCSAPTSIAGAGVFAVNTAGSTDSAQQTGACVDIHRDVWFSWTATTTQSTKVALCGAAIDTVIAIYPGSSCPSAGTQLACNDDACGLQSLATFNATSGSTYLIQIGSFEPDVTFSGTFAIEPAGSSCLPQSSGPDVIVGDISGVSNYTAANGLDAFTLGTTACNAGNMVISWSGPTPGHPVIGETFYKYKIVGGAGHFEEIGISWLKHGFASDTQSLCCTCQNPGNNQIMGVGCSDAYSASQAGAQSTLTPRWEVNAHTGVFPYPGSNPSWSGSTARRCEVALAELEPSGGTTHYYAECTYVTHDDATWGNNNNNATYREMTVTGGPTNYTFATTATAQRSKCAIQAWPTVEPGVTLKDIQVPNDGLFIVGSHATDLGSGVYHYEYAVLNMNSDRGCGSFSVPVAGGVNVTNIGFHDITYRNGDGNGNVSQTSTDWPGVVSGGVISWACETPAQNANANAIRWAGMYNFRFDADVAPIKGDVTLGLWKVASPAQVTARGDVPGGGPTTFAFCAGDGTGTACPCGNNSATGAGQGCLNSLGNGGSLSASGNPSISADTFVLSGAGMPDASALYFQGTSQSAGGTGVVFGDGLQCAGGSIVRLSTKPNVGGASQYPSGADLPISVRGADAIGDVRTYQCWYRNAASFCQAETFNLTNGVQTTWQL